MKERTFQLAALVAVAGLLAACAAPDPYTRLEVTPPQILSDSQLQEAFNQRWPQTFTCTQTVVLDFGPVTRTFVGYLAVERPHRFRLQGMTEQGVKLFDLARNERDGDIVVLSASDELKDQALKSISRDVRRVFLSVATGTCALKYDGFYQRLESRGGDADIRAWLTGDPPRLDSFEVCDSRGPLFRIDQYDWTPDLSRPAVIVLRDRGHAGLPYKLTLRITDFKEMESPFAEKTFFPAR